MVPTGRLALLMMFGIIAVVARPTAGTALLWILGVVILALIDWWLAPKPHVVVLTRRELTPVRKGDRTTTTLVAHNSGPKRLRGVLRDAWQPSADAGSNRHHLNIGGNKSGVLTTPLQAQRRGTLRAMGVTIRLTGPLGIAARQSTFACPGELRSLPKFDSRRELPSRLAQLRELDGRSAVRIRGPGTEFDSLREYVRGDDVRSIDWRATARHTQVMVRTWQPERDRRVIIVMDTSRGSAGRIGNVPRLDAAMEAAQLLTAVASKAGDRINFLAGDAAIRAQLRGGSRSLSPALADMMADLEPVLTEADWDELVAAVLRLSRQRAFVVLLTPLEPAAVEESLLPSLSVLTRYHQVLIASMRDPAIARLVHNAATAPYQAAAAERELTRRNLTAQMVSSLGAQVLDTDEERLPAAVVDHYLTLKRAGKL
jgi:uncharacterized protein (DUF58 family)